MACLEHSRAFELAKSILQSEEVVRLSRPVVKERKIKNDAYFSSEIPLSIKHDCYSIDIPTFFDSINFVKFAPCTSAYSYRINHGKWIDVSPGSNVVEKGFIIESIDMNNVVGTGTLNIYLEGISINVEVI